MQIHYPLHYWCGWSLKFSDFCIVGNTTQKNSGYASLSDAHFAFATNNNNTTSYLGTTSHNVEAIYNVTLSNKSVILRGVGPW